MRYKKEDLIMKRVVTNVLLVLLALLFAIVLIISNIWYRSIPIATIPGSYAESYAKEHHLKNLQISDSIESAFDRRYESFEYNHTSDGIIIESYHGSSSYLVIPQKINGIDVVGIGSEFFDSCPNVTDIVFPFTIISVDSEPTDKLLHIVANSTLTEQLTSNGWNIEPINDSEYSKIDFSLGDNPFVYNTLGNTIEITGYYGNEEMIILPSHIDGIPVTKVSMNMLDFDGVVFPDTVTEITGQTYIYRFDAAKIVAICFSFVALISALIAVNRIIPGASQQDHSVIRASQATISIIFLAIVLILNATNCIFIYIDSLVVLFIINLAVLFIYWSLMLTSGAGKTHIDKIENKQINITNSAAELKKKASMINLDSIEDSNIRSKAKRLLEDIKYSAPSDTEAVTTIDHKIESALSELCDAAASNNTDSIQSIITKIDDLLKDRAYQIKNR